MPDNNDLKSYTIEELKDIFLGVGTPQRAAYEASLASELEAERGLEKVADENCCKFCKAPLGQEHSFTIVDGLVVPCPSALII